MGFEFNTFSKQFSSCKSCKERFSAVALLNDDQLEGLQQNCREITLKKNDHIYHEGSLTSHIVYLRDGLVLEYKKSENGRDQVVQIIKSLSYLGLNSLFGDRINHYSCKALNDVKVCYIDVETFKNLVRSNGDFAYEILVSVSRDNLNSHRRFLNINAKQTFGKVADALLYFGTIIFGSNTFKLPITRDELGSLLGITRESTTRALAKFQNEGFIKISGSNITLLQPEQLQKISKTG